MEEKTGLVKAKSKAYGYDYASLSDIVKQGKQLPKMRVARHDQDDYIEYFDGKEWNLGARVVIPDMKGSNDAQRYGSALTYARRYTAQMALALACDDDKEVETKAAPAKRPAGQTAKKPVANSSEPATDAQIQGIRKFYAHEVGWFEADRAIAELKNSNFTKAQASAELERLFNCKEHGQPTGPQKGGA